MSGLLPFPDDDLMPPAPPQAVRLAPKLKQLAAQGIYFGTSSWKYEGWIGSIYTADRYLTRGKFSQKKFDGECLAEYAEVFPTVCGDFAFYQFPSPAYWQNLFGMTPRSLLFGLKVPEDITVARWPKHARYGKRAGLENEHFLDAGLFAKLFARPLDPYRERVATLIFEFGTFARSVFPKPEDFYARLDSFLGALPEGFRYAVEIRNAEYLRPEYLALLAQHGVAHVLNAWTRMPTLDEQAVLPGVETAEFSVVRALLTRGRSYEKAVEELAPYETLKEPDATAREGLRLVAESARKRKKPAFLFINNRLEGHAPTTIESVADRLLF
ncbi:MAG: DUF72 domain-containing protein [Isosphaeraceae bacterium]